MDISFNPLNLIQNNVVTSKMDFLNNYGKMSSNYNALTPLGEQNKVWFYFVLILSLILTGIFFYQSRKVKDVNGNDIEPTNTKKIYKILAWIFLGISIILIFYSGYMYFFIYSPQYNEWFNSLPPDAKTQLNIIKSLDIISNNSRNRNYNRPTLSLINI